MYTIYKYLAIISLPVVAVLVIFNLYLAAFVIYLFGGWCWVRYDTKLPVLSQPLIYLLSTFGEFPMYFVWPYRMTHFMIHVLKIRLGNERYDILVDGDFKKFSSITDAVSFAKKKAKEKNDSILITDRATYMKPRFKKELDNKAWLVNENGKVKVSLY